jgi:hypothetical protein
MKCIFEAGMGIGAWSIVLSGMFPLKEEKSNKDLLCI